MITIEELIKQIDQDFYKENNFYLSLTAPETFAKKLAIEFAKLHVTEALRISSESTGLTYSKTLWGSGMDVDRNAILNAYPLTNII